MRARQRHCVARVRTRAGDDCAPYHPVWVVRGATARLPVRNAVRRPVVRLPAQRETFDWHAVATLAIWYMTLLIQRVAHRDTQAIQAKLDELLHVQAAARNELTRIDEQEPEEIERHRQESRRDD